MPNITAICVDKVMEQDAAGRIYTRSSSEPVSFSSLIKMINHLEQYYDSINFPQSSTELRSFKGKKKYSDKTVREQSTMDVEKITSQRGEKGTFIVNVQYRQHATWQGQVVWAEKNKKKSFRSVLELLKLIDNALDMDELEDGEDNDTEE